MRWLEGKFPLIHLEFLINEGRLVESGSKKSTSANLKTPLANRSKVLPEVIPSVCFTRNLPGKWDYYKLETSATKYHIIKPISSASLECN